MHEPRDLAASAGPSTRQVMLGVFIAGQVLFLLVSNGLKFVQHVRSELGTDASQLAHRLAPDFPNQRGHASGLVETLEQSTRLWGQASGQAQDWSLFAPTIGRQCVFLALQLKWEEEPASAPALAQQLAVLAAGDPWQVAALELCQEPQEMAWAPETFLSPNEPADLEHYLRIGFFRLRRYENNLVLYLRPYEGETEEEKVQRWRTRIQGHVSEYGGMLHAYARWRLPQAMASLPGRSEPRQVILLLRRFQIQEPDQAPPFWVGPDVVPLARWQPGVRPDEAHQLLEYWDPVSRRFQRMPQ